MPCTPVLDPQCVQTVDNDDESHPFGPPLPDIPGEIGGNALEGAAKALQEAVGWFVSSTSSWWVNSPSPDLEKERSVGFLQGITQPVTITVAVLALLAVAAKMTLTRKANPMIEAGGGLSVLVVTTVLGAALPNVLLEWGDAWSEWVLKISAQGGFSTRMTQIVTLPSGVPAGFVFIMCLIALFVGIVQAILMLFRQGALIILAGMLPLAAAGMLTNGTRKWFLRVAGWMLALAFYKPLASLVYATAFALIGNGRDVHAVLLGFTMMLVSLIAFPVLLEFFNWTTSSPPSSSGGGVLTSLIGGATAVGALRSYGWGHMGSADSSANEHAAYLDQQLGSHETRGSDAGNPTTAGAQPEGADNRSAKPGHTAPTTTPASGATKSGTDQPRGSDHSVPPGSGDHVQTPPTATGSQGTQTGENNSEPTGPAAVRTWKKEQGRGADTLRWMGQPSGSSDGSGAPTGADDGGDGNGGT
ncbi:hypothetical protein [Spirillospora sp. CA-294931]|uniref:hypothetical protein n=1 Tax=Spirillospora sp. CA-294931 TaxID=3240042 RepID=UPI003D8C054C